MALVGYWKCDERPIDLVTSVLDYSGHANNHDFASVGYYKWFSQLRGRFLNACRYSENNGDYHASVNNNADFLLTGDVTISAWVRRFGAPGAGTIRYLISCGVGGSEVQADNYLWSLVQTSGDGFGMFWEQGAGVDVTAYSPGGELDYYDPQPLQHIAVVRSINGALRDVKFYVDGIDLVADVTGLTPPDGGANAVCEMLRSPTVSAETFHGNVALVRVYDTAESPANIAAIYAAELPLVDRLGYSVGQDMEQLGSYPVVLSGPNIQTIGFDPLANREAVATGTNLDQVERPNSGWASEGP